MNRGYLDAIHTHRVICTDANVGECGISVVLRSRDDASKPSMNDVCSRQKLVGPIAHWTSLSRQLRKGKWHEARPLRRKQDEDVRVMKADLIQ
nr:hypothetical protein CFP56_24452 [Quercus suber]